MLEKVTPGLIEQYYRHANQIDLVSLRRALRPGSIVKVHIAGKDARGVRMAHLTEDLEAGVLLAQLRKVGEVRAHAVVVVRAEHVIEVMYRAPERPREEEIPISEKKKPEINTMRQSRVAAIGAIMAADGPLRRPFPIPSRKCLVRDDEGFTMVVEVDHAQPPFFWGYCRDFCIDESDGHKRPRGIEEKARLDKLLDTRVSFCETSMIKWED